jgi:hypothetical protein
MTARITKAALVAQLEAAHVSYEKLATECEALRRAGLDSIHERALLREEIQALRNECQELHDARERNAAPARPLSDFRARCAAARELAMRSGRCVRVS